MSLPVEARQLVEHAVARKGLLLFLTGSGISAESGVPTFRGPEGYWKVGSRNYRPEELATRAAFRRMPDEVWGWYLHRRSVCRAAKPNDAHRALASLESVAGDRFLLITQNVDGLHLRAGSSPGRTYQIHGNIDFMRCAAECSLELEPVPYEIALEWPRGRIPSRAESRLLRCRVCGGPARPHVLWFDETYDEPRFRFTSSLEAAARASLLVVVGTTGATNLPFQIGMLATRMRVPMIVVNLEPNPFSELASAGGVGAYLEGTAGAWVVPLAEAIVHRLSPP